MPTPTPPAPTIRWRWMTVVGSGLGGMAILLRSWWMSRRGLDLTDEGMYLNWMSAPWDWPWASTQFAFFFHPLWTGVGQDLVTARRLTVVLLLSAGTALFGVVLRRAIGLPKGRSALLGLGLAPVTLLGVGSQSVFFTPSYNMLGLMGLALAGTALCGILLPRPELCWSRFSERWPWVLLGLAGTLCFASRPTAAALLLVLVMIVLWAGKAWSWGGLLWAAGVSALTFLVMALVIDRSLFSFLGRVLEGIHLYSIQTQRSAVDALVNTFAYPVHWQESDALVALALAGAIVVHTLASQRLVPRRGACVTGAALILIGLGSLALGLSGVSPLTGSVHRSATVTLLLFLGSLLAVDWRLGSLGRRVLATVAALALLPFCYAFGTHYSTLALAGSAGFCWCAASLLLMFSSESTRRVGAFAPAVWLLATVLCMNAAMGAPPRQEPLVQQQTPLQLAGRASVLVSAQMAEYLESVRLAVSSAGYSPGNPVLDLTGESPGLVYHLQAKATADSWVIGRYPGSQEMLAVVFCQCHVRSLMQEPLALRFLNTEGVLPEL